MKKTYVHLISDSTGDTLSIIAKTVFAQFDQVETKQYLWALVKTRTQLERVLAVIRQRPGIIMHTISNEEHVSILEEESKANNIPCVEVLRNVVRKVACYLKKEPNPEPGKHHVIDKEYFKRVGAINFTITHDDGQYTENLRNANIILVGPSRTSKSPTSMYLAYKGFKTANIPYVSGVEFPKELKELKRVFFVGLLICAKRLVEIRKSRLLSMSEHHHTSYVDEEKVKEEMLEAKRFCVKNGWPIIDITNKSVEETSARIIQMYYSWRKKK
jgi:[pyruvate, water dikinase]-phosphate phosphotransferase / [pyruvate, water dikinase] kinase